MDAGEYRQFTDALVERLRGRAEVRGVVALGSMAERGTAPDAFSDHDFFVITEPGAQESFRRELEWLPHPERIAFWYRETEHGLKALYDDGHLVELAVFDLPELRVSRVNRYRVLFDRGGVEPALAEVAERSRLEAINNASDDRWLVGQLLSELVIGSGRGRRGEELSARAVLNSAVRHLVILVTRHVESPVGAMADNLDPVRRFERIYPLIGARLRTAMRGDAMELARTVAEILSAEIAPRVDPFPSRALDIVRRRLG